MTTTPMLPGRSLAALALLALGLAGAPARAQVVPPDELVRSTSEQVLKMAAEDTGAKNGSTAKLVELIETRVVPHFDMRKVTRLAVGRPWREATPEQQATLVREFQNLLVRSYAAAYTAYRQVKVEVPPVKLTGGEEEVVVKTRILLPGGAPPVGVDYAMGRSDAGWKVFNVTVDGVSLVTTYRNEFAAQIQNGGIDGLIGYLRERNARVGRPAAK
ncbi:MAG: phospholipid-binding protein MlaC [Betaproteobacteria bacterium]|jgi:phospholipid transport system substrate-binding protein|nr:ABC transporter substrate-binding protein [Betaproteobacteria bacterium]